MLDNSISLFYLTLLLLYFCENLISPVTFEVNNPSTILDFDEMSGSHAIFALQLQADFRRFLVYCLGLFFYDFEVLSID